MAWPVFRLYIAACGGSASCLLILVLFIFNVGSSAFCQWWLSYWINQGSGVRLLLLFITSSLSSPPTDTSSLSLLSLFFQNTTVTHGNSSTVSASIKDNPMMQHYAAVYASSMCVMLLFKLLRGVAFVKVRGQTNRL